MAKKKVMLVFGTRPEAIKMAPLALALKAHPDFETRITVTAQHREMLDQVLDLFGLCPDVDLNLMKPGQGLTEITCRVLEGLKPVLQRERPDVLLVHGDTTTTFAAALAAFYEKVPVGHVEAGLRTHHKYAPFPEELNRNLTGVLADWHFAPTVLTRENLLRENIASERIMVTGNTVIDAFLQITSEYSLEKTGLPIRVLDRIARGGRMIVLEAHRRENWGEPMASICRAARRLVDAFPDCFIVFPVHRNPVVRETVGAHLDGHPSVELIEPLEYRDFAALMGNAHMIMTDSGGIQEEAPSKGVPVLVLREVTERQEALEAGTVCLAGTNEERILAQGTELLTDPAVYHRMASSANPYGDGKASCRIIEGLRYWLGISVVRPADWRIKEKTRSVENESEYRQSGAV